VRVDAEIANLSVMNKRHILDEIKRTAAANGGVPLGMQKFLQETGIKRHDWLGKIWARWGDALREAGFEPNQMQAAYSDDVLIEKFIGLLRDLRHFPVDAEVDMKARSEDGFPVSDTFRRAFGSKKQFTAKLLDYCKARSGYDDVIALCPAIATVAQGDADRDEIAPEEVTGFVYLMKSGRHYKIGRSNAAGRREYELAIQMPEKLITVHTIRTDDPAGIEDYWHRRFAVKRKNGEWFDLAAADVKAFKRRKFM
jgi:Meiotically up-regulated gene 113